MKRQRGLLVPLPLILYGVAALAIAGALWGLHHAVEKRGYERGMAECREAAAAQREKELKAGAVASTKVETDNAKSRAVYRTITRTVDKIVDRPVYRNVCIDPDGLQLANAALRGALAPAGEPDRPVPGSDAARGADRGGRAAEDR